MRVIGYTRVSTSDQELGIDVQKKAITEEAGRRGWNVVWIENAGRSGKDIDRPGIQRALHMLKMQEAEGLVVAKLDRLSRSLPDFVSVLQIAKQQGWGVISLEQGVDTTTASGRMVAGILASVAEWERDIIAQRTKDALAIAKERGVKLGPRFQIPEEVRERIRQDRARGMSLTAIAAALDRDETPTAAGGKRWYPSTVKKVLEASHQPA